MKKLKIGLVLGGGGARGLAHLGVLKALEKHKIAINIITGTSMGAIVGAMFANTPQCELIERKIERFIKSDKVQDSGITEFRTKQGKKADILQQVTKEIKRQVAINMAAHRKSLINGQLLHDAIDQLISGVKIESFALPFACSASDLRAGESYEFYHGPVGEALKASAAIPGIIPPVEKENLFLVDGSVNNNFPIEAARKLGADIIIAINVSQEIDNSAELENVIDIIIRSNMVSTKRINEMLLKKADYVLTPDVGHYHWSAFDSYDALVHQGFKNVEEHIEAIKKMIAKRSSLTGRIKYYLGKKLKKYLPVRI